MDIESDVFDIKLFQTLFRSGLLKEATVKQSMSGTSKIYHLLLDGKPIENQNNTIKIFKSIDAGVSCAARIGFSQISLAINRDSFLVSKRKVATTSNVTSSANKKDIEPVKSMQKSEVKQPAAAKK